MPLTSTSTVHTVYTVQYLCCYAYSTLYLDTHALPALLEHKPAKADNVLEYHLRWRRVNIITNYKCSMYCTYKYNHLFNFVAKNMFVSSRLAETAVPGWCGGSLWCLPVRRELLPRIYRTVHNGQGVQIEGATPTHEWGTRNLNVGSRLKPEKDAKPKPPKNVGDTN